MWTIFFPGVGNIENYEEKGTYITKDVEKERERRDDSLIKSQVTYLF